MTGPIRTIAILGAGHGGYAAAADLTRRGFEVKLHARNPERIAPIQKAGGIESLKPQFDRIRKAYLIGEAADHFAATLGDTPHEISGTLEKAVASALADARSSNAAAPVVLLSPACASFDQFKDFEQRGDAFRALVQDLASPERQAS